MMVIEPLGPTAAERKRERGVHERTGRKLEDNELYLEYLITFFNAFFTALIIILSEPQANVTTYYKDIQHVGGGL